MKKREPVSHIMTKNVKTLLLTDSLHQVMDSVKSGHVRHIPIVSGNKVVGIITSNDLNRLSVGELFDNQGNNEAFLDMLSIERLMHSNPVTISEDTTIREVAELFANSTFHALPVVNAEDELVGIVSTTDVLKYMLDQY